MGWLLSGRAGLPVRPSSTNKFDAVAGFEAEALPDSLRNRDLAFAAHCAAIPHLYFLSLL
jgi:hypothetical protein